ncbi:MAG: hypothetical protein IJ498_07815 [Akkermansia sp.]|nr:hypothetical protein [Akkermansia sp.]
MSKYDDKYDREDEDQTQVRNIIRQINEEKPSQAKKREVVVRPDGTKVIRVTKKRRVLMTEKEIRKRSRKHLVAFISIAFLALCIVSAFFFYRMAVMSGESYLQSRVDELKKAWGAESVRVVGTGISGTTLHINSIVAEFPDDCLLEQVELTDLSTELSAESFFREIAQSGVLKIKRANFILRPEVGQMRMPLLNGVPLWKFDRMECDDFSVSWGRGEFSRLVLRNGKAHLYYPRKGRDNCVISCTQGTLMVKNWQTIYLSETKIHLSPVGIEDLYITGSVEMPTEESQPQRSSLVLRHRVANDEPLAGAFQLRAVNMPFADFTGGRFETFFTARTSNRQSDELPSRVTFTDADPVFSGDFELEKIMVTSFPAITAMLEHIEPRKRRQYLPPTVEMGTVQLSSEGDAISLELPDNRVVTRDSLALKGKITINAANELSGTLVYGLPGILTRAEYTDGAPDPIFENRGEWTWLSTSLKGFANRPDDNMADIEALAVEARKSRPERLKFDSIDVDKLSGQMKLEGLDESAPNRAKGLDDVGSDPFAEPDKSDNPFEPLSPF